MDENTTLPTGRITMRKTDTGWNVHYAGKMVGTIKPSAPTGYIYNTSVGTGIGYCGWNTNRKAAATNLVRFYFTNVG